MHGYLPVTVNTTASATRENRRGQDGFDFPG